MKFFKTTSFIIAFSGLFMNITHADDVLTRKTHLQFVEQFILPNLQEFNKQANALNKEAKKTCIMAGKDGFKNLKTQLNKTVNAWMPLQSTRYDAFEKTSRSLRIYFWPNSRGGKQALQLLKSKNMQKLEQQYFKDASVAIQGLPIIEWLLYHKDSPLTSSYTSLKNYACDFLFAASLNVKIISSELLNEFSIGGTNRKNLLNPSETNPAYNELAEVTLQFYKSIHAMVELVHGQKLSRPTAKELQYLRPKRLELWRSNQTKNNLLANIEAISSAYNIFSPMVKISENGNSVDQEIKRAFQKTIELIQQLPDNLYKALSSDAKLATWQQSKILIKQLASLQQILATKAIAALNIPLGFNALDGD